MIEFHERVFLLLTPPPDCNPHQSGRMRVSDCVICPPLQVAFGPDLRAELVEPTKVWSVEYVKILLQQQKLDAEAGASLPSLDILFASQSGGFQKFTRDSPFSKQLARKLLNLEAKHAPDIGVDATGRVVRWQSSDARFREAYELLRLVEMQRLQREIESQVHDLLYLQSCASRLGDRPGDLKKVRRDVERGKGRVKVALHRLKQWGMELTVEALGSAERHYSSRRADSWHEHQCSSCRPVRRKSGRRVAD